LVELLRTLNIDVFIQVNTSKQLGLAAKTAAIPIRVGSLFRSYNWWLCTHLVAISRAYKGLNKRLLDLEYLKPLGIFIKHGQPLPELHFSQKTTDGLAKSLGLNFSKHRIILHPSLITSQAHQWPLTFYEALINSLDQNKFQWIITGTQAEKAYLEPLLTMDKSQADVLDAVGRLTLDDFVTFIGACDGMVAGSTGPLHLATALGLHTLGFYQSNPAVYKRWAPLGLHATTLSSTSTCRGDKNPNPCPCILAITPQTVQAHILSWFGYQY
jgi:ADP-heptose:LPS heptosyltransferase